jgi:hypothetical protein
MLGCYLSGIAASDGSLSFGPGQGSLPIADIAPLARSKIKKPSTEVAYLFGSTF